MKKTVAIVFVLILCALGYRAYDKISTCLESDACLAEWQGSNFVSLDGGPVIQGSGNVVTRTRPVAKFTTVVLESPANVEITRTGAESLTVTGEDNLVDLFTSEVKGDILRLAIAPGKSLKGKKMVFRMTVADVRDIRILSSGDLAARDLRATTLTVSLAGSGNVRLAGHADDLALSVAGAGDIDAAELTAGRARVAISGSGDITVNASDTLDVRVSGAGDVRYLGTPKVTQSISGSGTVAAK